MESRVRIALVALLALSATGCRDNPSPPNSVSTPNATTDVPAVPGCRPDISASECAQAQAALERDAETLVADAKSLQDASSVPMTDHDAAAAIRAQDCAEQRRALLALQRMQRGEGEQLSEEERAQLPEEISRIETRLAASCG